MYTCTLTSIIFKFIPTPALRLIPYFMTSPLNDWSPAPSPNLPVVWPLIAAVSSSWLILLKGLGIILSLLIPPTRIPLYSFLSSCKMVIKVYICFSIHFIRSCIALSHASFAISLSFTNSLSPASPLKHYSPLHP